VKESIVKNLICFFCSAFLIFITIEVIMADETIMGKEKSAAIEAEKRVKVKTLVFQGNRAFAGNRYDEALGLYKKAIEIDSTSEDAHYNSAIAYERKGMINESIEAYKKLLTINPDHAQAHNNLGILYEKKEMPIKAFSEFKQAVSKDPNLSQAQYNLGRAYFTEGLMEQAAEHLYVAGLLFLEKSERKWAENSYNLLKKTNSEDLTAKLSEKMDKNKKGER
jgi:tetratricopeptide (TPR) repeat protein